MQGQFCTKGRTPAPGLQPFDADRARDERPEYVVFNGRMGALAAMGGGNVARNVQTTLVPAGGGTIMEFKAIVPGRFRALTPSVAARGAGGHGRRCAARRGHILMRGA